MSVFAPRRLAPLIFALLLCGAAAAADLTIGVGGKPPLFSAQNGELSGFNADIARALCAEMAADCALKTAPAAPADALAAGDFDAVIASLPAASEDERIAFSKRYYKNGVRFARRDGDKSRVSYKRLAGKTVAVVSDAAADFVAAEFDGAIVRRYAGLAAAYKALAAFEADFVAADQFAQAAWLAGRDEFQMTGAAYTRAPYFSAAAIAVRAGDETLRQNLNRALAALRENGVYRDINRKYFSFDIYGRGK